jgi:hypothetical protein
MVGGAQDLSGAITRRRRNHGDDAPRKVGWQVSGSVADAVKRAVEEGAAESQNAFVEAALLRALKELRREKLYSAYAEAAADPVFIQDMEGTSGAFDIAAPDGLEDGS